MRSHAQRCGGLIVVSCGVLWRASWLLVCVGCGLRTPRPIDVDALLRARGPIEARRDLEIRILADPRDVVPRLALAAIDEQVGRPSEALAQLEVVDGLSGPLGTRWRGGDRARLARLLLARGKLRAERGAPSALADLTRARELRAQVESDDLASASAAVAIADLRHTDDAVRARGRRELAAIEGSTGDPAWRGARKDATPFDRGGFGVWLWDHGAHLAAWEALKDWHDTTPAPRDPLLESPYLKAFAWWTPSDAVNAVPAIDDLEGPERCRFAGACTPGALAHREPPDLAEQRALLAAPIVRTSDPNTAAGYIELALLAALRGELAWGATIDAYVGASPDALPPHVRPLLLRLAGQRAPLPMLPARVEPIDRLIVAAEQALDGASPAAIRETLGATADSEPGKALLRVVEPPVAVATDEPLATAAVAYVRAHLVGAPSEAQLRAIALADHRDPAIADRLGRDLMAESLDAAIGSAALAALFDALGDPARARLAWQAAADGSPEPAFFEGLAEAESRASDPDAALINATTAAAASGDPAVVWLAVASALHAAGHDQQALEAARSAIDLAGPEVLGPALDVAIAASRILRRDAQADELTARRARIGPAIARASRFTSDPTDAAAAVAEGSADRLWVASRWNPRDIATRAALAASLATTDPRRATIVAELVTLAGDADSTVGRAAVAALR